MSTYKRGKVWWYDFTIGSDRYRGSTKLRNEKLAENFEAKVRTEALENAGMLPRKAPRLRDFIPIFKQWNKERGAAGKLKPRSIRYYLRGCVLLESTSLINMAIDRVTADEVEAVEFTGSNPYRNQAIRTLHRLLALAVSRRYLRVAPRLHLYKETGRETVISKDAEAAVTPKMSKAVRDAMWLMKDAGMRRDEVARMRIEWIDWQQQMISIPDGKTSKARRRVPMSKRVFDAMFVRCGSRASGFVFPSKRSATGHIGPDSLTRGFARARDAANLGKDVVLYSARHTFGTDVYAATGNLKLVMTVMGHDDNRTAMRYQHPEIDQVRAVIDERNETKDEATQ